MREKEPEDVDAAYRVLLRSSRSVRHAWVQFDSIETLSSNIGAIAMPGSTAHAVGIVAVGWSQKSGAGTNTRPAEAGRISAGRYSRCLYMIVVGSRSGVSEPRA